MATNYTYVDELTLTYVAETPSLSLATTTTTITPGFGAATYSGVAPTATVRVPITITPDSGAVVATGIALVERLQIVVPLIGLTLTGVAPEAARNYISVLVGSVTYTGRQPGLQIPIHVPVGSLTTSTTLATSTKTYLRSPLVGSVTYGGVTPTLRFAKIFVPVGSVVIAAPSFGTLPAATQSPLVSVVSMTAQSLPTITIT